MTENEFLDCPIKLKGYIMWAKYPKEENIDFYSGAFSDKKLMKPHPSLILFGVNKQDSLNEELSSSVREQQLITIFGTSKKIYDTYNYDFECDYPKNVFYLDNNYKCLGLDSPTKWVIGPSSLAKFPVNKTFFEYTKNFKPVEVPLHLFEKIESYINQPHVKRMLYDLIYKNSSFILPPESWKNKRYKE